MKKFQVVLTRAYAVDVYANSEKDAKQLVEFFMGDPPDRSNESERRKHKFKIVDIEMTMNEAFEASEYQEI